MKYLLNILLIFLLLIPPVTVFADYVSLGVRDPMEMTAVIHKVEKKTDKTADKEKTSKLRQREIFNIIKKCRIEGVVISNEKRFVLINDRLLAEGDKISPDSDVYIYKIDYKLIKFSLDGQIASYPLSISK